MKRLYILISGFFVWGCLIYSQTPEPVKYQSLEPYDFHLQYLKADSALVIDVREYDDFRKSRIKDAINIPYTEGLDISADTLDKKDALFIYCYAGGRSQKAAAFFYEKGFRRLYSLKGGMGAWRADKMEIDRKKLKKR